MDAGIRWLAAWLLVVVAGCDGASAPASPNASATDIDAAIVAAEAYLEGERLVEAELILDRLVQRAPRERRARELFGRVLTTKAIEAARGGDEPGAEAARSAAYEQYRLAAELRPPSAGLHQSAGVLAIMAGEPEAALAHFESAAAIDPSSPQHPLYAAQVCVQRGDLVRARAHLERVLALDPDQPEALASLAIVALQSGDLDGSLLRISEARRIAPGDLQLRVQEARIRRRRGELEHARDLLVGLDAATRADRAVCEELAASLSELGEQRAAAEVWVHRYAHVREEPNAYRTAVRAGDAFLQAGDRTEAARWYRRAAVEAPAAPEVTALKRRLRDR